MTEYEPLQEPADSLAGMIAQSEAEEAFEPHVVLVYDPETRRYLAFGPVADGIAAQQLRERMDAELNSPGSMDGPPVQVRTAPLMGA